MRRRSANPSPRINPGVRRLWRFVSASSHPARSARTAVPWPDPWRLAGERALFFAVSAAGPCLASALRERSHGFSRWGHRRPHRLGRPAKALGQVREDLHRLGLRCGPAPVRRRPAVGRLSVLRWRGGRRRFIAPGIDWFARSSVNAGPIITAIEAASSPHRRLLSSRHAYSPRAARAEPLCGGARHGSPNVCLRGWFLANSLLALEGAYYRCGWGASQFITSRLRG